MREVQLIERKEVLGKDFRVYGDNENPLFLAKDVAKWIGHSNSTEMVKSVDDDEKLNSIILSAGQKREMCFLTEDGLYEVLMQSRKPIAKQFKKEVKTILRDLRLNRFMVKQSNPMNFDFAQAMTDIMPTVMQNVMVATQTLVERNNQYIRQEIEEFKIDASKIITHQEIAHEKQLEKTRELIGFRRKNTASLSKLLKVRVEFIKDKHIRARDDYHYQIAKQRLFKKYKVTKWEDFPLDKYDEIHADIDSVEDLDDIWFIK